ncbi:hypothetical protein Tco_1049740 [Tanacetum coccineum]
MAITFLRYIDTRPKGDALRKCILDGPYQPTIVTIPYVPATENSLEFPKRTAVETVSTMSPENKDHYESDEEAIHSILTGIGDEIYSTVDACKTYNKVNPSTFKMSRHTYFGSLENSPLTMEKQWNHTDMDGYCKYHKKRAKNGQSRTREGKSAQEPGIIKLWSTKQAVEEEQNQPEEEPAAQSFLLNLNFPMADDDDYTVIYRKPKAITSDLPTEEPDNSLNMGDEHLNTIPETKKSSVENLISIPNEFKGISEYICDVPSYDNDHFNAEFGLINSLLSRDISITSPKIDFLPEEFAGELDLIDPILPGIDDDDFNEEEGAIDNDILQIEDEILREKLLNVNLLIDKIKALNLIPSVTSEFGCYTINFLNLFKTALKFQITISLNKH